MENRRELLEALEKVLGPDARLAVCHSSFAALCPQQPLTKWDALAAVRTLVDRGWTLAFPSFTFSFCQSGQFNREKSASETGLLADWVRESLVGALRTDHPIYSFVVIGSKATEIASCKSATTFGDDSPFGFFERHDAKIVMLGADWTFCTPFHRYEELAKVGYRYLKTFEGRRITNGSANPASAAMWVRDLGLGAINDWRALETDMRARSAITSAPLWRGRVEASSMSDIRSSAMSLLEVDPLAFVGNADEVRHRMQLAIEAKHNPPYHIAILGTSNLDIVQNVFDAELAEIMPGRRCKIFVPPLGQTAQQIVIPGSDLSTFKPALTIFVDRLEDLVSVPALALADGESVIAAVEAYAALILRFAQANGGTFLVHRFALIEQTSIEKAGHLIELVAKCNQILSEVLGDKDNVFWFDLASEAAVHGPVSDQRLWQLGRIPFAPKFTSRLARRWAGVVLSQLGKTVRLLVLDLDNTLWGGVLGEDGAEGIAIGGDFPGNAFRQFQLTLKLLSDAGIALAVSSKNDADVALDVLNNHKSMVIRPIDIVSHRISWQPKWQSIREIAAELDLGLESVMFIDDNPVERESVRANLPQVKILELPQDVTRYVPTLLDSPFIEIMRTNKEDSMRVASYKARAKVNAERTNVANIDDFFLGLGMELFISTLDADNLARAAQLCQKTNQFNTTTRRYSARDLEEMRDAGTDVAVIALKDKYLEKENIGLIMLRPDNNGAEGTVDLFLLSCRVLGRTVEHAVLSWALARARTRGWDKLNGELIETPRNTPVRKVFADNQFLEDGIGLWRRSTTTVPELPRWFILHNGFE